MAKKKKLHNLWTDFKAFISRGNVVDMAVGVIMGSAFGAIVTAFTNILLSICTWGVPGGISGLVTVLPAANETQKVPVDILVNGAPLQQTYTASEWAALSQSSDFTATIGSMYTAHGGTYYYNKMALIDWGSFINAIITFLIIALTLFVILKIYNSLKNRRVRIKEKLQEEYYEKHPEERPVPAEPAAPAPTDVELLMEIRDLLKKEKTE